jgi:hypothetical protein
MPQRRTLLQGTLALFALPLVGCDNQGKEAESVANDILSTVLPLIERDCAQVRKGLPNAVKLLEKRLPDDAAGVPRETQVAIKAARENDEDLRLAKSTFFVFTSTDGVVIRSENDPDRLVDKNIFTAFPTLKTCLDKPGVVEAFGEMEEMRGVKRGIDTSWVIAHQVLDKDGKVRGAFVSGWSFRAYAYYLEQQAKSHLLEQAKKTNSNKVPVGYVYLVKGQKPYGAPDSPEVNGEEIAKSDLAKLTEGGRYRGQREITKRTFGVAAERAKALGDDTVLAIVASVY